MKVSNYKSFAAKEIATEEVVMSAVFHKDEIGKLLADADAIRIYMIKDSDSGTGDDVSYMMVPVVKEDNDRLTEQLFNSAKSLESGLLEDGSESVGFNLLMAKAQPCMGPLCR